MASTTRSSDTLERASQVAAEAQQHSGNAIEMAARAGYATKGVVYMVVGTLAAMAAWGAGGQTTGSKGAIAEIGSQAYGQIMLWIIGIGLAGFSLWRFVQCFADPDNKGTDAKAMATRAMYFISGLTYAFLAYTAMPLGGGGSSGGGDTKKSIVAQLMSLPAGRWIVGAIGLIVAGYGCYMVYKGLADKFMSKFSGLTGKAHKVALYSGRLGLAARGIVFAITGGFVVLAAVQLNPDQTKGVGEALDVLGRQPYGAWVLLAVAIGLFCYGVFSLVKSRYRTFNV